jgi:hypothetical protein
MLGGACDVRGVGVKAADEALGVRAVIGHGGRRGHRES